MLTFVLASLLAAPPVGESWSVTLRPAIVVKGEETSTTVESPEAQETAAAPTQDAPTLAPAKALVPKAKIRKARTAGQASPKKR